MSEGMTKLRRCKHCGEKPQVLKMDGRTAHACRVLDRELRMTVDEWNAKNEDATDELRRLLDECGAFYEKPEDDTTIYYDSDGNRYTYNVNPDSGWAQLFGYNLTPEQAIIATLERKELERENSKLERENSKLEHKMSNMETKLLKAQEHIDELLTAATLRSDEPQKKCSPEETETIACRHGDETITVHVMECDRCGGEYEHVNGDYEYCPRCGAKIEGDGK